MRYFLGCDQAVPVVTTVRRNAVRPGQTIPLLTWAFTFPQVKPPKTPHFHPIRQNSPGTRRSELFSKTYNILTWPYTPLKKHPKRRCSTRMLIIEQKPRKC